MRPAFAPLRRGKAWPCVAAAAILAATVALRAGSAALPDPAAAIDTSSSPCASVVTVATMVPDPVVDRRSLLWPDDAQRLADILAERLGETPWAVDAVEMAFRASGAVEIAFWRGGAAACATTLISAPMWREIEHRFRLEREK